jgi:hypothetical protein
MRKLRLKTSTVEKILTLAEQKGVTPGDIILDALSQLES